MNRGVRYRYVGLRRAPGSRYGQMCNPVRDERGKCIIGRGIRNQLVCFEDGEISIVPARCLRVRYRNAGLGRDLVQLRLPGVP